MSNNTELVPVGKKRRKILEYVVGTGFIISAGSGGALATSENCNKDGDSIRYEDLASDAKRVFQIALESGYADYVYDFPPQLRENTYVHYQGEKYILNVSHRYEARYDVSPMIVSGEVEPRNLVNYENMSAAAKSLFETAKRQGRKQVKGTQSFPDDFFDFTTIKYNGILYELNIGTSDVTIFEITPEKC